MNEKSIFVSLIIKYIKDCSNNGLENYSLSRLVYFKFQDNSFKNNFYINYTFSLYETLLICPSVPYLHANSSLIWTCICSYPGNKHDVWLTFYFILFIVFNATFSNISAISWRLVLVVEEARVPRENHRLWSSNW